MRIHQTLALRVAYLVVRDPNEAEDVTQEALVKAYLALPRFRKGSPLRPWLLRIVRNEALNRLRGTKRRNRLDVRVSLDPGSGGAAPSPEAEIVTNEDRQRLLVAIEDLPDRYRAVVTHRYLLDLSEGETAAVLGIPVGTVKSRTSRAMKRLRDHLEAEIEEPA